MTQDEPEERRLARAVGADHADDAPRGQEEGQALDEHAVGEGLGDPLGLHHQVAEARARGDGNLQALGEALGRLGLRGQGGVGGQAGLTLGLARPGGQADPGQLARQGGLARRGVPLLGGQARGLVLEPRRVVALEGVPRPPVQLEDPPGHVVQEVAVVGDGHDRPGVLLERPLEPGHRLGVQVVGGLVEQEQVRSGQQQAAQGHAAALPARQRRHVSVGCGQAQRVHGDRQGALQVPGPQRVDAVRQGGLLGQQGLDVGVGRSEGVADLLVARQQVTLLAHPVGHVAHDVLFGIEHGLLGQVAHREAGGHAPRPGSRRRARP